MAFRKALENITAAADELDRLNQGVATFNERASSGVTLAAAREAAGADRSQFDARRNVPPFSNLDPRSNAGAVVLGPRGTVIGGVREDSGVLGRIGGGQSQAGGGGVLGVIGSSSTAGTGNQPRPEPIGNLDRVFVDNSGDVLGFGAGLGASQIVGAIGRLEDTVKNLGISGGTAARNAI